ncbi:glutathionylspermidine synthase family protein [Aeromicrobium sp. S22]|uniref:glutathionylspermidine synthase family protein n=1 Tax=Aeromicrobium sp. S22 TaxID=2662029 RepID=UPI00129D6450|nr:glutathionylspermidine synthase family protein [Aeromicrobium sp. S22]MRK01484.1 glutathionylspermidine synthase family protein [Aeromicrobium sp. S22]
MRRVQTTARPDWLSRVEEQGLTYAVDRTGDGSEVPYWDETAYYEFTEDDVDYLERVTDELHTMAMQAAARMADDAQLIQRHKLPPGAGDLLARSLRDGAETSIYGRFDLAWDGTGPAKLLEYNADTPAGLVEAAVCQWMWLEDLHPERDQWNMLHEHLVKRWDEFRRTTGAEIVHFAVGQNEPTEDWATVAYLRDTAQEAGLETVGITIEKIGWHHERLTFVDVKDLEIAHCFKMYPTEWMLDSTFGPLVIDGSSRTRWIEPPWKLLLGSKALLPVMWEMFAGHENLLPSYFDAPYAMREYVTKPLFGWEGDGVEIHTPHVREAVEATHSAGQELVYQKYVELPDFDGNHPVLGTWVIGGRAAGLGVRESSNRITNTEARFVPHLMSTARSSPEQVAAWLAETGHTL